MKKLLFGLLALSVVVSGCSFGKKDEKQAFIDATIKATCLILESENLFDPALETEAKQIYKDFGFDADDDAKMEEVTAKYENDEEVQAAVAKGIEACSADAEKKLDDLLGEPAPEGTEEGAEGEETPVEGEEETEEVSVEVDADGAVEVKETE